MSKAKLQIVIESMKNNPNVSAASLGKKLGIKRGYTYALMSRARREMELDEALRNGGPTEEELRADPVNHPPHYTQGGIETIDFIEAKQLGYNLGNVVKYVTRSAHKGARRQDLEKAQWYLNRELSNLSK